VGGQEMSNEYKHEDKIILIESKKQQIKEILQAEDITYGMAKTIIQRVEAELLGGGDTFLNKSKLKDVSPFKTY